MRFAELGLPIEVPIGSYCKWNDYQQAITYLSYCIFLSHKRTQPQLGTKCVAWRLPVGLAASNLRIRLAYLGVA